MTSFNTDGKPGYVYNQDTDTWYQIAGKTDTSGPFDWAGIHTFLSKVVINDDLIAKLGINNFLNPASRDSEIPSPTNGTICLIRQDALGNTINTIQLYLSGSWVDFLPSPVGKEGYTLKSDGIISTWVKDTDAVTYSLLMMGG